MTIRLLFEDLAETLLKVGRVMILPFIERMKSPKASLGQAFSLIAGFDAIQQHDCRVVCPDSTALCSVSRAHDRIPGVRHPRLSTPVPGVTRKKAPI
jgi:hypothetical protein